MVNSELYVAGLRVVMSSTSMASIVVVRRRRNRMGITAFVYEVLVVGMVNIFVGFVWAVNAYLRSGERNRNENVNHNWFEIL